jgi:drug/metabolite transporter (DMT)-like permease
MTYTDIKNKILYWTPKILAILFGAFLIVFGEFDDSPGAQLIGLVLVITGIVFIFKSKKKYDF